jgi:hypothetical protein
MAGAPAAAASPTGLFRASRQNELPVPRLETLTVSRAARETTKRDLSNYVYTVDIRLMLEGANDRCLLSRLFAA